MEKEECFHENTEENMVRDRGRKSCQKSPCHRISLRHYNCTTRCHDNKSLYRVVKYCIIRKLES